MIKLPVVKFQGHDWMVVSNNYEHLKTMPGTQVLLISANGTTHYTMTSLTTPSDTKFEDLKISTVASRYLIPMSLGSDPEVFISNGKGGVIPAWELVQNKHSPNNFEPYWDGVQMEMRLPSKGCIELLTDAFHCALEKFRAFGPLEMRSVMEMPKTLLSRAKNEYVALGCSPSSNAYGTLGMPIVNGRELPYRFAGMHMHFGFGSNDGSGVGSKPSEEDLVKGVKCIDRLTGLIFTAIGRDFDNPIRRQFYGMPGEYRLPAHGLEYRVLGSWVMTHPAMIHLAFDSARFALRTSLLNIFNFDASDTEVQEIITHTRSAEALEVLKRNKAFVDEFLADHYTISSSAIKLFWDLVAGVKRFDFNCVDRYWGLGEYSRQWKYASGEPNATFRSLALSFAHSKEEVI